MASREARNPFYLMLLIASFAFIGVALAYAIVPALEDKARDMGQEPPPSPFRDSLRVDGWKWLLVLVAVMVVLGLLSMGLDRWRRYRDENSGGTP